MSESRAVTSPSRGQFKKLSDCQSLQEAFETNEFKSRVADSLPRHISAERMLRTMVLAANKSPDIYRCNLRQAVGAFLTLSQLGLEPNTPLQHAFLIPFKTKVWNPATRKRDIEGYDLNVILGYPGLADLAFRSGMVTNIHADVVYAGDTFEFEYGSNSHLKHVPMGQQKDGDEPVWAYAHVGLKDGQAFEVMPWSAVMRVRDGSQGYKAALFQKQNAEEKGWKLPAGFTEAPWVKHRDEMAKKTPWRRLAKWIPKSPELAGALALEDISDRGRPDFGAIFDGSVTALDGVPEQIEQEQTMDAGAAFTVRPQPEPVMATTAAQAAPAQQQKAAEAPKAATTRKATPKATAAPDPQQAADDGIPPWMSESPPDEGAAPTSQAAPSAAQPAQANKPAAKWYNLADAEGELVPDTATTDPVAFAKSLLLLIADCEANGESPDGIIEANLELIEDASAVNPEAAELIRPHLAGAPTPSVSPWLVPVPMTEKGTPHLGGYVKDVKLMLASVTNAAALQAFTDANGATIESLPATSKDAIWTAVSDARVRFEARSIADEIDAEQGTEDNAPPAEQSEETAADDAGPVDPDLAWTQELVGNIQAATSKLELGAIVGGKDVVARADGLQKDRPDCYGMIEVAYKAKLAEFAPKR